MIASLIYDYCPTHGSYFVPGFGCHQCQPAPPARAERAHSPEAVRRFWAKVHKSDGCWEWTGKRASGYGRFVTPPGRRMWSAHRYSWTLANGPIPDGLFVLHHCDNKPCVRPEHLFLGTNADNMRDAWRKGRLFRQHFHRRGHCTSRCTTPPPAEYGENAPAPRRLRVMRPERASVHRATREEVLGRLLRYTAKSSDADGCWLWTGCVDTCGYGRFFLEGKSRAAHRISYQLHRGLVPDGLVLDHLCRIRSCVNPWHMEAVSQRENVLRRDTAT